MFPFQRLTAWRRAHALALHVLELTGRVSRTRHAIVLDRMGQTVVDIASRLAADSGAQSDERFADSLRAAQGAVRSLASLGLLALELELVTPSDFARLEARADELWRILSALRRRVADRGAVAPRPGEVAPARDQPSAPILPSRPRFLQPYD